jgi:hypothetical protein
MDYEVPAIAYNVFAKCVYPFEVWFTPPYYCYYGTPKKSLGKYKAENYTTL